MSVHDDIYRELILEHYRSPRNAGRLPEPDSAARGRNPLCGDDVEVSLQIVDGKVADARFQARGCSISQASASMMTEAVKGKSVDEARRLVQDLKSMMKGADVSFDDLGDVEALQGVRNYPARIKCALLAWTTLEEGLDLYEKARKD